MSRLILLIVGLLISGSALAQNMRYNGYGKHSNWFFGLNYGGTWHTTDVRTDLKNAGGFVLGRSYGYRQGSPIVVDLRGRFLIGGWNGADYQLTRPNANDNVLNGTYFPTINYVQDSAVNVLRNFRTGQAEANLELVLHLNRLREQTRWDVYLFGGIGITAWNARGNYLNDLDLEYDFSGLTSGIDLVNSLDDTHETDLEGSRDGLNVNWMPHAGFGFGYQLGPRVTFGVEHKTTFARTDLWDGLAQENTGSTKGFKDIYHYSNLYLRWYLRGSANRSGRGDVQADANVQTPPCYAPTLTITQPLNSHHTVAAQSLFFTADIRNITSNNQITVRVNGQYNTNFNYNQNSGQFSSNLLLNPGQNIIEVAASNRCGAVSDSRVVVFMPPQTNPTPNPVPNPQPQVWPPVVTIDNPMFSPENVSQSSFNFEAHVMNVVNRSQVQMTLNGSPVSNYTFNPQTGVLFANLLLSPGNNTVVVSANNQAGADSEQAVLVYNQPQQLPAPVVQFVNPNMATTQVNQANSSITANVFHVTNKQNITIAINGQNLPQSGFTFNSANSTVTFNTTLQTGANAIQITAMNTVGTDSKTATLIYAPIVTVLPPVVNYLNPILNPSTTFNPFQQIRAVVQHIENASQIQVWVNTASVTNFSFNNSSNIVEFTTGLVPGSNNVRIKVTNSAGSDDESTLVIYAPHNPILPPVVAINNPQGSPALATESSTKVEATVLNVETASGIQVLLNGQPINNFVFNATTHEVEFIANLNQGMNSVIVKGTNSAGQAQASQEINYKKPVQLTPPVVTFIHPNSAGLTVNTPVYEMVATVSNISNSSQIQVKLNGQTVASNLWSYAPASNTITFHTSLITGMNLFTVTGTNTAGVDSKTLSITYQAPVVPCNKPTVVVNTPSANNPSVNNPSVSFEATTNHVASLSEITVFLNGTAVQGWNYNASSKKISGTLTLNEGNNVAEILVKNQCGKQRVTFLYNYTPTAPCLSPVITTLNPTTQYQTQETSISLNATSLYVTNVNEVQFYVNGTSTPFNYDPATKLLSASASLVIGSNVLRFEAMNTCGKGIAQWTVVRVACNKPVLNLSSNVADGATVSAPEFNLSGTITNVSDLQGISVSKNGQGLSFVFNQNTDVFNLNAALTEGNNAFVVAANNSCGSETYKIKVTYTKPIVPTPPSVDITNPEQTPFNTQQPNMTVSAEILNVTSPNQITVQLNGSTVPFVFNVASNTITFDATWIVGANTVVVTAQNPDGTASDSKTINFSQPVTVIRPLVVFTNPTAPQSNTENTNFTFTGHINNLSDITLATAKLNGQPLSDFGGQVIDGKVHFNVPVTFDNSHTAYTLEVKGQNTAGVSVQSRQVTYEALSTDDPVVCMPTVGAVFAANFKSVVISSTKELSNVVLKFQDNSTQIIENLSGLNGTFQGNTDNAEKCIIGVWIKSGCNSSNDGPGYGEFVSNNAYTGTCAAADTNTDQDNSSSQIGGGGSDCLPSINAVYTDVQKRVTITSNLALNNVVLKFHDNTIQQFNNLFGKTRTLTGTGANVGKCIVGVWVKSGCNSSTDGPNYGAYYENTSYNNECAAAAQPCGPLFSLRNASWEFCINTPNGVINRNDLAINSNYTYDGTASSIYLYASGGGGSAIVNGSSYPLQANNYYLFPGSSQIKVTKNDPSAPGQWMICITTDEMPTFGDDNNRPTSPCEGSSSAPRPGQNSNQMNRPPTNPNNNRTVPPSGPNPNPRQNPNGAGGSSGNNGGGNGSQNVANPPRNINSGNTTSPSPGRVEKPKPTDQGKERTGSTPQTGNTNSGGGRTNPTNTTVTPGDGKTNSTTPNKTETPSGGKITTTPKNVPVNPGGRKPN